MTSGILFALKRDYNDVFAGLPERSRLLRLLKTHRAWCDYLVAQPSFFTVLDSYPFELVIPCRRCSKQQIGTKGGDKGHLRLAIKLCWRLTDEGQVVAWDWAGMNVYDEHFHPLIAPFAGQTIVLADLGYRDRDGVPDNLKLCAKGTWNERMVVETALSLVTVVCGLKQLRHRFGRYF